jgi:hypothetical protein
LLKVRFGLSAIRKRIFWQFQELATRIAAYMFPALGTLRVAFAAMFFFATIAPRLFGYALEGPSWPAGSTVNVRLAFTGPSSGPLQDGFTTFNASAADALALWNQQIDVAKFSWTTSSFGGSKGDRQNTAFFSSTVYGQTYGSAIAVTVYYYSASIMEEADNLFNSALLWDSYRGPLQYNFKKGKYVYDFHRVAIHEFGHTLGLAHPDDAGQTVTAIMNRYISGLDHLAPDDISGSRALYAALITSILSVDSGVGQPFAYQITATNNPTSYGAVSLPPGLEINSSTGIISGNPTVSGTFQVTISASGGFGSTSATLTLKILGPQITSATTLYSVPIATPFSYRITATNNPTSFTATGLPQELMLDSETGLITGIPTAAGEFIIQVGANTSYGAASAQVHIFILPPQITSLGAIICSSGDAVNYQITAQFSPTGYACSLLPAGLIFDSTTGTISGVATLSGNYTVTVTAHTVWGDASKNVSFTVARSSSIPNNLDVLVKRINVGNQFADCLVADPQRPRVYVGTDRGLFVFNTTSLTMPSTPLFPAWTSDAWISADGQTLWCLTGDPPVRRVDLNTLITGDFPNSTFLSSPRQIRDGLNGHIYISVAEGVSQIDAATGALQHTIMGEAWPQIEISRDRRTLYVLHLVDSALATYDVSGQVPVLKQSIGITGETLLAVRHDDRSLCISLSHNIPASVAEYSTTNLGLGPGFFNSPAQVLTGAFSHDDAQLFLGGQAFFQFSAPKGSIGVFNSTARALTRSITTPDEWVVAEHISTDSDGNYLFALGESNNPPELYVYKLFSLPRRSSPSLTNVSTRAFIGTDDLVEIGGFIITGTQSKKVIVRALAPSLQAYGIANVVSDPVLELRNSSGAMVATNDNWKFDREKVLDTGIPPGDEHECAIVTTLNPGNYTAILRGLGRTTGIALFELYDLDPQSSTIANISTRGNVGVGDNVMIGGFIVDGDQPTNVIVRALGPTLTDFGLSGALADPTLELHGGNGAVIAQNDNWKSTQQQAIQNSGYAPPKDAEAAILTTLQPGNYTAIVRGKNNTTGVALVEVYNLDAN